MDGVSGKAMHSRVRWGKGLIKGRRSMPSISISILLGSSVIETNMSECLASNSRHFEEAQLVLSFNHKLKRFMQFSVNRDDWSSSC